MVSHSVIQWLDDQIIQTGSWPFIKHSSIQEQVNMHAYLHRWLSHTKAAKIVLLDKQENKEIYPSKSLKTQSNAYEYLHSVTHAEIIDNYCCLCSVSCTGYVSCYIKVFNAFSVLFQYFFYWLYKAYFISRTMKTRRENLPFLPLLTMSWARVVDTNLSASWSTWTVLIDNSKLLY